MTTTSTAAQTAADSTTDGSAFEGLFQRALKPEGEFKEALRRAGYDLDSPQPKYPSAVWEQCLEIARLHVFPTQPPEDGLRQLGRRFIGGFFETIFGKFIAAGLPIVGPGRMVKSLPRYFGAMRSGSQLTVKELGSQEFLVTLTVVRSQPYFMCGLLEAGLGRTGKAVKVEPAAVRDNGFDIRVSW